jgi:hypothetical protein
MILSYESVENQPTFRQVTDDDRALFRACGEFVNQFHLYTLQRAYDKAGAILALRNVGILVSHVIANMTTIIEQSAPKQND